MFWEKKLEHWVENIRHQAALPLRLQLWNGRQFDFGKQAPEVTVRVPHVSSLPFLLKPTLANLGRAYVEGRLDVEGRAREVIAVANALAAHTLKQESRPGWNSVAVEDDADVCQVAVDGADVISVPDRPDPIDIVVVTVLLCAFRFNDPAGLGAGLVKSPFVNGHQCGLHLEKLLVLDVRCQKGGEPASNDRQTDGRTAYDEVTYAMKANEGHADDQADCREKGQKAEHSGR